MPKFNFKRGSRKISDQMKNTRPGGDESPYQAHHLIPVATFIYEGQRAAALAGVV